MTVNDKRLQSVERLLSQPYLSAWAISYWNKVKLKLLINRDAGK
jgi:hypothetical protein